MSTPASRPLVSVVIPAHNYAHYVGGAIESVLGQRYRPVEIVVVDDGSTDDTTRVLAGFGERIRVARMEGRGVSEARNHGSALASGELILFLDADDLLLPGALEALVEAFRAHRGIDAAYGSWYRMDVRTGRCALVRSWIAPGHLLPRLLRGNVVVTPSAMLLRRRAVIEVGGFDPALSFAADWDLWLRLALREHRFGSVPGPVAIYRVHAGSMTRSLARAAADVWQVLDKIFADPVLPPSLQAEKNRAYAGMGVYLGKLYLERDDEAGALVQLREALQYDPGLLDSVGFYQDVYRTIWSRARDAGARDRDAPVDRMWRVVERLCTATGEPVAVRAGTLELGMSLMLRLAGDYRGAMRHLARALRHDGVRLIRRRTTAVILRICLPPSVAAGARGLLGRRRSHAPAPAVAAIVNAVTKQEGDGGTVPARAP